MIGSSDVEKIAALARLSLSPEEITTYEGQLANILKYIDKLNEIDTSDVEPTYNVVGLQNVTRIDEPVECLTRDEALANAPDPSRGFYRVPRIIE